MTKEQIEDAIIERLKTVYDPEIPVNIYEMGLIYDIKIDDEKNVEVVMTLTTPNCPVAESLPRDVEMKISNIESVKSSKVTITFEPPWTRDMMSESAMLDLGFL